MNTRHMKNPLIGTLVLAVTVVWVLRMLTIFPPYIDDLIVRAAPVVLIIVGLSLALCYRVRWSGLVSVVVGLAITGAIGYTSFTIRESQVRDDNTLTREQVIDDAVILLRVRMETLDTDVEVVRLPDGNPRTVRARYDGSTGSDLVHTYVEDDDLSATFTLSEIATSPVPMLEQVGRGTMLLELPYDVPVDVQLQGTDGDITLNTQGVQLERLSLDLPDGDVLLTLPAYQPLFSRPEDTLGGLAVRAGALTIRVPEAVAARFDMSDSTGGDPDYDPNTYNLLFGRDVLEARLIDSAEIVQRYDLFVSRDRLTVEALGGGD